jgi:hypothetical protein
MNQRLGIILLSMSLAQGLDACEIRVRDAAFRTPRDVHRLCVIANREDAAADKIQAELEKWLAEEAEGLNIRVERINADDPETDWSSLGVPGPPPALPVTALIGHSNSSGENFVIDHWEPSPDEADLAQLLMSPVRKKLQEQLGKHLAVLLYFGTDGDSETRTLLRQLTKEPIKDERIGLGLIEVDPSDSQERLLLSFAGFDPASGNGLYVAFGQGKLLEPPLFGPQINREEISSLLEQLCQTCSCSQPLPMMGVDLPIVWSAKLDSMVVLMDEEQLDALEEEELILEESTTQSVSNPPDKSPPAQSSVLMPVLWTLAGLVLLVGVCGKFLVTGRAT